MAFISTGFIAPEYKLKKSGRLAVGKYKSFAELKEKEETYSYRVRSRVGSSEYLIIAPHGGRIEPGASELADHIAGDEFSFYSFDGIKKKGNKDLHVASEKYDEKQALELAGKSDKVISIHGAEGNDKNIYIGGLDEKLIDELSSALKKTGFPVSNNMPIKLRGKNPNNICNKGILKQGVQIEITHGLRKTMFEEIDIAGRKEKTAQFNEFVQAIQKVLNNSLRR